MGDTPTVMILRGSPTPLEQHVVAAAILRLWQDDRAAQAAGAGVNPWVLAARTEGTGRGADAIRGRSASSWRAAGRFSAPVAPIQPGRGDAR